MGACQSTTSTDVTSERRTGRPKERSSDSLRGRSTVTFASETEHAIKANSMKQTKKKDDAKWPGSERGYSSGASSAEHLPGLAKSAIGPVLDKVGIGSLKTTLIQDGDLGANIVRMETPFGKPIEEVYEGVHTGEVLGSGISGIARLITHRTTGVNYAAKTLDLGLVKSKEGLERLREEIFIMCQLDHPNIVRLEEVYESASEIYLVMELCKGGDLFDRLDEQPDYHYDEAGCARLVKQMLSSLRYLHSKSIIHRDLKLENFLFSTDAADSALKMIDFGLSKHFQFGEVLHDAVGTPYAVAPEIIIGNYDEKCDVWSIGVITYLLFSGETPFGGAGGEDLKEVRANILRGQFSFVPEELWEHVSDMGRDFVRSMLDIDPKKRPTAKQAQCHPWIQTWAKKDGVAKRLNPKVVEALVSFKELSDMQKLLSEVLSFTLLPEQIEDLRKEFEKVDSGDGEITLTALKKVLLENAEAGSLGALTEQEIEDIFQALRVSKDEPTIHWHEFIAAGLSQCKVDDRNLRLAFDRLDVNERGYITLDSVLKLMGSNGDGEKQALQDMWMSCLQDIGSDHEQITYDEFLILMKGQSTELVRRASNVRQARFGTKSAVIPTSIPEGIATPERPKRPVTDSKTQFVYKKQRSRSLGEQQMTPWFELNYREAPVSPTLRRPSLLRIGRESPSFQDNVTDVSKSPLMFNRSMYRAHREMRLAVLEASKRFDELKSEHEKIRRAEGATPLSPTPSLTMKRTSAVYVPRPDKDDIDKRLDDASHHGGRHRRTRRKTMSDVTGMMKARS